MSIFKLSINIRYIRKVTKNLTINIGRIEIRAKKAKYTTKNRKDIILLVKVFYLYKQMLFFGCFYE